MSTTGAIRPATLLLAGAGIAVSLAVALLLAMDLGPLAFRTHAGRSGDGLRTYGSVMALLAGSAITFPIVLAAWARRAGMRVGLAVAAAIGLGGVLAALIGPDLTLSGTLALQLGGLGLALLGAAAPAVALVWALCAAPRNPSAEEPRGGMGFVLAGVIVLVVVLGAWVLGII